jgi:hypothetical protein
LAYTLIGGTIGGTILTLIFLPALYATWFRIKPTQGGHGAETSLPDFSHQADGVSHTA